MGEARESKTLSGMKTWRSWRGKQEFRIGLKEKILKRWRNLSPAVSEEKEAGMSMNKSKRNRKAGH